MHKFPTEDEQRDTLPSYVSSLWYRDDQRMGTIGGSGVQGALALGSVDQFESPRGTCWWGH